MLTPVCASCADALLISVDSVQKIISRRRSLLIIGLWPVYIRLMSNYSSLFELIPNGANRLTGLLLKCQLLRKADRLLYHAGFRILD